MSKLNLFIKDTFFKIIKSASFIIMLLMPLVIVGIIVVIGYFAGQAESGMTEVDIALLSDDPMIEEMLAASDDSITVETTIQTEAEAQDALGAEEIDGYLTTNWDGNELEASLTHNSRMENHLPIVEQVLSNLQMTRRAQELAISPEEVQSLNEPVVLESHPVSIDAGEVVEEDNIANLIAVGSAYFINIMIMTFIMFYASTVIEEIAREKGTRMMEVILSSTTATTHFFGKLIGVFLVMIVHVLLYLLMIAGAFFYFRDHEVVQMLIGDLDIGAIILEFLQFSSAFLIVGVLMYMFLAAFLGSLITKTEDIGRASGPLTLVVLLGFYIGLFAMVQPENIVVVVSSYIPFLTPFVMPFRIATNTVGSLQVWLALAGSLLFTILVALVSLAFYRANVLIYSDTSLTHTIKQSWSLLRSERESRA